MQPPARFRPLPWLACVALAAVSAHGLAQDHGHGHGHDHAQDHAAASVSATAAPAQRWVADANLSHGMAQVRASVEALGHAEHGHMGPGQVVVLARTMDGYIGDILATCKLDPNADAALHGVLAQLLRGTDALKQGESLPVALATMRQALEQYPRLFDDPQWHALAPSGH